MVWQGSPAALTTVCLPVNTAPLFLYVAGVPVWFHALTLPAWSLQVFEFESSVLGVRAERGAQKFSVLAS